MLKKSFLLSILITFVISNNALAQYASSPAARDLINSLYEAESALEVGVSNEEYKQYAIKINTKLNVFLTTSDYREHPLGGNLLRTAEDFVKINEVQNISNYVLPFPVNLTKYQILLATNNFNNLKECLKNIKYPLCYSIPQLEIINQQDEKGCSELEGWGLSYQCKIEP